MPIRMGPVNQLKQELDTALASDIPDAAVRNRVVAKVIATLQEQHATIYP